MVETMEMSGFFSKILSLNILCILSYEFRCVTFVEGNSHLKCHDTFENEINSDDDIN